MKTSRAQEILHLNDLDEFLAASILDAQETPIKLEVCKKGDQGHFSIAALSSGENIGEGGIDYELSSCECGGIESREIVDFLNKPVFTSSAHEFFDFVFMFLESFKCLVDFSGNGWRIKIIDSGKE